MGAIVTDLLYYAISIALVVAVGQALSRSGRAFLHEVYGGQDGAAQAVSRLLVVAFYLLSLGFVALTAPSSAGALPPGRALELLTGKVGVLLLVLGALHVTSTVIFARLRRGRTWTAAGGPADGGPARPAAPPLRRSGSVVH
ncbi:MAG TPA: hypothetical protein VGM79_05955 [Streptosporangiaceae bacterium]|jgi:hypothetical protein